MITSKEELKQLINSIPYPENIDFKPLPENEKELISKNKNKEFRKQSNSTHTKESLENNHDLYKFLKESSKGVLGTEAIKWNFTKFLVDKNGKVVKRYASSTKPNEIEKDILDLL